MNNRKWSKHIIKRFGKQKALLFAKSNNSCPCLQFNWKCDKCEFGVDDDLCPYGRIYWILKKYDKTEIKRKIREAVQGE